jgi:toxin ParE1/3/4
MKPVRITPRADNDIDACFAWIAKENPAAALRFLDAIELTCDAVSRMPGIAGVNPDGGDQSEKWSISTPPITQ